MRPNILYIMSDDHAANAISCYHSILQSVFQTPNMDRLYQEGCRMDAYCATNAICTPARASIMTGQYGQLNGVRTLGDKWNPETELNLARILKENGYQTAMFGKWHLIRKDLMITSIWLKKDRECLENREFILILPLKIRIMGMFCMRVM